MKRVSLSGTSSNRIRLNCISLNSISVKQAIDRAISLLPRTLGIEQAHIMMQREGDAENFEDQLLRVGRRRELAHFDREIDRAREFSAPLREQRDDAVALRAGA